FELSRMASRRPSSEVGRLAIGIFVETTEPRGSNTSAEFASVTFINMAASPDNLKRACAVGAAVVGGSHWVDRLEHRRAHVAPAGNEGGEASGASAHHEQMDVVGRGHDRDPRVRIALEPFRQVPVIDLAIAVIARDGAEGIARIHPEVITDV